VLFSSRHPEELKDLVAGLGPLAQNGTVSQAVAFGDALFFAVPHGALPQLGRDYGGALQGKIVLDACNAVPARDGLIADEGEREGIGITSQKYLPGTHLVRAFNTLSYTIFVRETNRPDPKLTIPIAGDDGEALAVAAGLVRDAGFEPVVVGKLVDASQKSLEISQLLHAHRKAATRSHPRLPPRAPDDRRRIASGRAAEPQVSSSKSP